MSVEESTLQRDAAADPVRELADALQRVAGEIAAIDPGAMRRVVRALQGGKAEAIDLGGVAEFLGVSYSFARQMNLKGHLPMPARLAGNVRKPVWPVEELRAWLMAGTPSRSVWAGMRKFHLRNVG